jgi:hypothetical protein
MIRFVLILLAIFCFLTVLRGLRIFFRAVFRHAAAAPKREEEMVRDPVCGTWIDRRLALSGRRGNEIVSVCSAECRHAWETRGTP